ncbi:cysteine ABC transporter permease, partial [Avibacterium paragallinarum]
MLNNFLASLPFMTDARAELVINGFLPMVKAAVLVSIPLAVVSFILG